MAQAPTRAPRPTPGTELEVSIDALAFGGNGIGRHEGYVVFVRGAVPGDRVRVKVGKAKRAFAEATLVEVLEPSPIRIPARAEHPGAPWQVLPYERQLEEKTAQVRDALSRLGRFPEPPVEEIIPAEGTWRYRNKMEYSFGPGEDGQGIVLGFHRAGRWDLVDPLETDVLASERIDALRRQVERWCRDEGLPPYDRGTSEGFLRNLVIRESSRTGQIQARLVTSPGSFRTEAFAEAIDADGVLWTEAAGVGETTREGRTRVLAGAEHLEEEIMGLRFRISPDAFFQTNTEMAERLYSIAGDLAGLRGDERVFDLFCGIGTIALALSLRAREMWGVEIVERAVADAIENARLNEIENARFFAGNVRTAMRPLLEEAGKPDVVVVDPPRAGLSQKEVRRLIECRADRIVYVSCNPTTLAPNGRQLVDDGGYELRAVQPVDMFPQTPHIECVALLERRG